MPRVADRKGADPSPRRVLPSEFLLSLIRHACDASLDGLDVAEVTALKWCYGVLVGYHLEVFVELVHKWDTCGRAANIKYCIIIILRP